MRASKNPADTSKSGSKRPKPVDLGRVLLVEDDAVLGMDLEHALVEGGAREVVICQTMKATMQALETDEAFDAIVLDVHLADRDDGWALAELIAMLGTKMPRIAFSTGSPGDIPENVAEMGPVFEKPYDPQHLVRELSAGRKRGLIARLLS